MPVRRTIPLTEANLKAALADERARGARPATVAVGADDLAVAAHRILDPRGLGQLTSSMPNVEHDDQLGLDEWELR